MGKIVRDRIIRLTDGVILKIRRDGSDLHSGNTGLEEISYTFRAIQIENVAASTSVSDDWTAQNQ